MTDAQKQQLRELATKHRGATQAQQKALAESRIAFHKAAAAETVDEAAVKAAADKLAGLMTGGALAQAKFRTAVRDVFTAEQREKLKALRQSHTTSKSGPGRQGMHGGRGHGRHGGDAKPAEKATEKAGDKPAEPAKSAVVPPKAEEKPAAEEKSKVEEKSKTTEQPKAEEKPEAAQSSAAVPDDVGPTQSGTADS